jgi:hypothetical protein
MSSDPNIKVTLTDPSELHCFRIEFNASPGQPGEDRHPIEIYLHTRQAFDLFHKLGSCLMDYFADRSAYLIERLEKKAG